MNSNSRQRYRLCDVYTLVKREREESDKMPYNLPLLPTESPTTEGTPGKDDRTIIIIFFIFILFYK
jgi:hypothetical protein